MLVHKNMSFFLRFKNKKMRQKEVLESAIIKQQSFEYFNVLNPTDIRIKRLPIMSYLVDYYLAVELMQCKSNIYCVQWILRCA